MTTPYVEECPQADTVGEYSSSVVSTRVITTIVAPAVRVEPTLPPTQTRSMSFHVVH